MAKADWDSPAAITFVTWRPPIPSPWRIARATWVKMSKEYPSPGMSSEP